MRNKREETKQLSNHIMKGLHDQYMGLAKIAEQNGDRVLSESHYQRAEYFLHAINEQGGSVPIAVPSTATVRTPVRASNSTKRVIKDFDLKRTYRKRPSDTLEKPLQEGSIVPFRGHYLRRNRRNTQENIQDKEIPE